MLLDEAVRRDMHFVARHPTTLFQCLWNSCWWYDCPEAARHYQERDGPWSRPGPKLHKLLEAWRRHGNKTTLPRVGLTLVTHNTREFSGVPGLKLEDWED